MRSTLTVLVCVSLVSCAGGLGSTIPEVRIVDLDPEWGPVAGGTPVTVTGFGFEGDVAVWFGDTPLPTTRVDSLTLVVTTPAATGEGYVDVKVTTQYGEATMEEAYLYTDDIGGFTTPTGTGTGTTNPTGTNPSGMIGGLLQHTVTQISCPQCLYPPTSLEQFALAAFHDPTVEDWSVAWPPVGTCETVVGNYLPQPPIAYFYDAGPSISVRGPTTWTLSDDGTGVYEAQSLTLADFEFDDSYDVTLDGGADIGAQTLTEALRTPPGFITIEPWSLITKGPTYFLAEMSRSSGFDLAWTPVTNGTVVFDATIVDSGSPTILGRVICHEQDLGSLTVPASLLTAYPAGSLVSVYFHRNKETFTPISGSGHDLHAIAQIGVMGTARITN